MSARMETKHTPGPWTTGENPNGYGMSVFSGGQIVADCSFPADDDEARANARLCAAVLDLLAAGQMLLDCAQPLNPEMTAAYDAMRAAIAKASGELTSGKGAP